MNKPTKNMKISTVEETNDGLYVWETGDGKFIKNEDGDFLLMPSKKNDAFKLERFKEFAHNVMRDAGVEPSGRPVFLAGFRKVSDEVYEEQKARRAAGLVPDQFDVGSLMDDAKTLQKEGRL